MKKKIKRTLVFASLMCIALTSCEKDPYLKVVKDLKVTTEKASYSFSQTNVSGTTITTGHVEFFATFEWMRNRNHSNCFGAVYYGKEGNLSVTNNLGTTEPCELADGTTIYRRTENFSETHINTKGGSMEGLFSPGDTMYYRAYAKVNTDTGEHYIYGEEKFLVISK